MPDAQAVPSWPADGREAQPSEESAIKLPPGPLSERQQLVRHMIYDQQMDIAQISGLLKVSVQTVRNTKGLDTTADDVGVTISLG